MKKNPYFKLGQVLIISGAVLTPVFNFVVNSVPLAALSLSAVMLGLVSAMLGSARPNITPEASQMMLKAGVENIAALLEELGIRSKAIYFPSNGNGRRPRAVISLNENGHLPVRGKELPNRLIARYGPNLEDMCLVVTTLGAVSLDGIAVTSGGGSEQIGSALSQILVGVMDVADSVTAHNTGDQIVVEVVNPKLKYDNIWYYRCLGSPLASIAATVASQALDRPVRIASEQETRKRVRIEIEVLP